MSMVVENEKVEVKASGKSDERFLKVCASDQSFGIMNRRHTWSQTALIGTVGPALYMVI
jgi:hypothetical protein